MSRLRFWTWPICPRSGSRGRCTKKICPSSNSASASAPTTEALPGRTFTGKIAQLYPHLDALTRTLRVRFNLDNPDHQKRPEVSLRPGMFATVRVDVPVVTAGSQAAEASGKVLAVPEDAVVYTGSLKVVYRREGETVFDAVPVTLGPLVSGPDGVAFYPILSGPRRRPGCYGRRVLARCRNAR